MTEHPAVDLRLVLAAAAGWLAVLWGLSATSASVAGVAIGSFAGGLAALRLGRRWPACYAFALALSVIALLLAPLAARLHLARDGPLARLAVERATVTAELVTTSDPRPLATRGPTGSTRVAVEAGLRALSVNGRRSSARGAVLVLAPAQGWRDLLPGERIRLEARLLPPHADNLLVATLSADSPPERIAPAPWWQRAAGSVRAGLRRAADPLPPMPRGLLPGLVLGDTSQLDPVLAERFRVAGLTHLVAVSGTNCSILVGAVALALRRARASPRTIAALSMIVLVGFVVVARPSPSVLRAAVMAGIALAGLATGRQRSALPVLAGAVLLLLGYQPALAVDLGFALSVSATAALLLIAPGWAAALRRRRVPAGVAEALAVAAAAHLVTAPIVVGISGQLSLVAIPANMLAEPVVAAATVLGVLAALLSVCWPPAAVAVAWLAGWPCRWLVWVAERFGSLAGASVPWPGGSAGGIALAVLTVALLTLARCSRPPTLLAIALIVAVVIQIPVRSVIIAWPPAGWLIAACDVGQGDALAISTGGHSAVVIDAGPDPIAVDRCLRGLGVTRVPLLVLTHDHLDYVGGLAGVLHDRVVQRVLGSPLQEPAGGRALVAAALVGRSPPVGQVVPGSTLFAGSGADLVQLDVLGPSHVFRGTRSDPNNSSVVLRVRSHGRTMLLPGDAEVEAQDDLLTRGVDLRADILKVAHHGSAYFDPAFLRAVHASVALVSVGRDNDYGHPSPMLLTALARLGVPAHRTDLDGDLVVADRRGRLIAYARSTRSGNADGGAGPLAPGVGSWGGATCC
jgi:competence protein ComEC